MVICIYVYKLVTTCVAIQLDEATAATSEDGDTDEDEGREHDMREDEAARCPSFSSSTSSSTPSTSSCTPSTPNRPNPSRGTAV